MRFLFFISFIILLQGNVLRAQEIKSASIENIFLEQLSFYPQEKIYVQTDRSVYLSGETIWFRAHLVDALLLKQANASRYIYIELINPLDDIIQRIKIKPDSTGSFYGHIPLEENLVEGNYTVRAYTQFMQNQGNDYFFHKSVYITDPMSEKLSSEIRFFDDKKKIKAEISFIDKKNKEQVIPEQSLIIYNKDEDGSALTFKNNIGHYTFKENNIGKNRVVILQTIFKDGIYNRYVKIPPLDKTFDVTFFPEGGHAPFSSDFKMAFKAINNEGFSEDITGQIFDDMGQPLTSFETSHLGMGSFRMYYSPDRKYYAICTNKENISKRFDLPEASLNAVSLRSTWVDNYLRLSLTKSPTYRFPEETQLIAHIRGAVLYAQPWDDEKGYLTFEKDFFPAGIIHFLLIDKNKNILSERLVFSSQKSTFALSEIHQDKREYAAREKVELTLKISDENKQPISGNLSISVIDKKDLAIDTTSTIISTLLLSSELKGYIESPMSYLAKDDRETSQALDVLMMTQGWRRYHIPDLLKGEIIRDLKYSVELSDEVSGKAEGLLSSLKEGSISLIALKDSVIGTYLTGSDKKGLFTFKDLEHPIGTQYIVQALTKKNSKNVFININPPKSYPDLLDTEIYYSKTPIIEDRFVAKTNEKYTMENGMRVYNLAEVVITSNRKSELKTASPYYSVSSTKVLTSNDVEKWNPLSVLDLLRKIPGMTILGDEVKYRTGTPMVILDNVPEENFDYSRIDVNDIKDIFLSPPESVSSIFGSRAAYGAVVINTKKGLIERNRLNKNMQIVVPVGYQQTVSFYSPIYETKADNDKVTMDSRTTIYWNPNVQFDASGTAKLSFYAADYLTHYGIVLEGCSSDGHLIYSSQSEITVTTK